MSSAHRGRPLPWALREEIKKLKDAGKSCRDIARELSVNKETASKYGR